jgi:hypothetical protein
VVRLRHTDCALRQICGSSVVDRLLNLVSFLGTLRSPDPFQNVSDPRGATGNFLSVLGFLPNAWNNLLVDCCSIKATT